MARRDKLVEELRDGRGKLEDAVSTFNAAVEELKAGVVTALESYNGWSGRRAGSSRTSPARLTASSTTNPRSGRRATRANRFANRRWKTSCSNDVEINVPRRLRSQTMKATTTVGWRLLPEEAADR